MRYILRIAAEKISFLMHRFSKNFAVLDQKTSFLLRRILEALGIVCISSVLIFLLGFCGIIPNGSKAAYVASFGISAILFLVLNFIVLDTHFWAVNFKIKTYLCINLAIFFLLALLSVFAKKLGSDELYTAFFGYTKAFRHLLDISIKRSAAIFWAIYLLEILTVPVKSLCFDWECKKVRSKRKENEIND